MTTFNAGIKYASGLDYTLSGQGIKWSGFNVARIGTTTGLSLSFHGTAANSSNGEVRMGSFSWLHMTPTEATAIAGALLAAAQGIGDVSVKF